MGIFVPMCNWELTIIAYHSSSCHENLIRFVFLFCAVSLYILTLCMHVCNYTTEDVHAGMRNQFCVSTYVTHIMYVIIPSTLVFIHIYFNLWTSLAMSVTVIRYICMYRRLVNESLVILFKYFFQFLIFINI